MGATTRASLCPTDITLHHFPSLLLLCGSLSTPPLPFCKPCTPACLLSVCVHVVFEPVGDRWMCMYVCIVAKLSACVSLIFVIAVLWYLCECCHCKYQSVIVCIHLGPVQNFVLLLLRLSFFIILVLCVCFPCLLYVTDVWMNVVHSCHLSCTCLVLSMDSFLWSKLDYKHQTSSLGAAVYWYRILSWSLLYEDDIWSLLGSPSLGQWWTDSDYFPGPFPYKDDIGYCPGSS